MKMSERVNHVSLKRAAQALGVHEQTLRSWEKRGLIRMMRLPGSNYRRVPVTEVERLTLAMQGAASSMPGLVPPNRSPEAVKQANELAESVCAELAGWEETTTFDELMAERRGRAWLP